MYSYIFSVSLQLALAVHSAIENNTLMMETFTGKPVFRYAAMQRRAYFQKLHKIIHDAVERNEGDRLENLGWVGSWFGRQNSLETACMLPNFGGGYDVNDDDDDDDGAWLGSLRAFCLRRKMII